MLKFIKILIWLFCYFSFLLRLNNFCVLFKVETDFRLIIEIYFQYTVVDPLSTDQGRRCSSSLILRWQVFSAWPRFQKRNYFFTCKKKKKLILVSFLGVFFNKTFMCVCIHDGVLQFHSLTHNLLVSWILLRNFYCIMSPMNYIVKSISIKKVYIRHKILFIV